MSKFNSIVLTAADGTQVHFVTRARAKSPTMDEVTEYLNENNILLMEPEKEEDWVPPSPKMFLIDLRSGLTFCSSKYGVSEATVERYIREMAPHINASFYNRSKANG